jgi:hypothetical protein
MDNSKFRALLATPRVEKASAAAPAEMTAEERARRKAKQQASHERRMAIEKRRQEALAEANRYTDRAAQRRKEESRQAKEEGVAPADRPQSDAFNAWLHRRILHKYFRTPSRFNPNLIRLQVPYRPQIQAR